VRELFRGVALLLRGGDGLKVAALVVLELEEVDAHRARVGRGGGGGFSGEARRGGGRTVLGRVGVQRLGGELCCAR